MTEKKVKKTENQKACLHKTRESYPLEKKMSRRRKDSGKRTGKRKSRNKLMGTSENLKAGITGATGFIGGKLAERLANDGFSIRCLVRETSNTEKLRSLGAELVHGDLCDSKSLQTFPQGCDYVFHLASKVSDWGPRDDFFRQNVEATETLLDSSREVGVRRFVYMSFLYRDLECFFLGKRSTSRE